MSHISSHNRVPQEQIRASLNWELVKNFLGISNKPRTRISRDELRGQESGPVRTGDENLGMDLLVLSCFGALPDNGIEEVEDFIVVGGVRGTWLEMISVALNGAES